MFKLDTKKIEEYLEGYLFANQLLGKNGYVLRFYGEIQYRIHGIDRIYIKYDKNTITIVIEIFADAEWKYSLEAEDMMENIKELKNNKDISVKSDGTFRHRLYEIKIHDFEVFKETLEKLF